MTDENEDVTTPSYVKRSMLKYQRNQRLLLKLKSNLQRQRKKSLLYHRESSHQSGSLPTSVQKQERSTAIYLLLMLCCSVFAILLNLESRDNPLGHVLDYRSLSLEEREEGELVELLFPSTLMNTSSVTSINATNANDTPTKHLRSSQSEVNLHKMSPKASVAAGFHLHDMTLAKSLDSAVDPTSTHNAASRKKSEKLNASRTSLQKLPQSTG